MKKAILIIFVLSITLSAKEYLVRIPYTNSITTSSLIKQEIPIVGELSDAALALVDSSQLALLSGKNYTILDEVSDDKNYFLVNPMSKQAEAQIRASYKVLTTDNKCFLISAQPGDEDNLAKLPIMLSRLDFTPVILSEQAPAYPDIVFNVLIEQMVNNVSSDTVLSFVQRLQAFRSRYSTSESCRVAANWLRSKFLNYNCDSVYLHNFSTTYAPNVVAIKRGYAHPDNIYYVVCGHFDAVNNCFGADDNASGTTAVLEAARVMKNFNFEYSIRYIAFSAEEQGLIGSAAYAQQARNQGDSILGVFNFDMISYADIVPENLEVFGKISNPNCSTFVNYFINSATLYVPQLATNRRMVSSLSGSDHHSFWQNGYVGLCGIEDYPLNNPYYHTSADSIGAGFNNLSFCTNSIKAGVAGLAGLANPIFPNQPLVVYRNYQISDSIGNNNGRWDVGETTKLFITLRNIGQTTAYNVSATIACTSSFVIINQNQATFGNIVSLDTSVNLTPFIVSSTSNTPIGYNAGFNLTVISAETTWNYNFVIPIGAFISTDPIPDGPRSPARYWAYDNTDTMYSNHPDYNWVEIKNLGTRLSFANNDQVKNVPLPTGFGNLKFYGQSYNSVSISADGWVACGFDTIPDYSNSSLPNSDGPAAMIAANWDDLVHSNTGNGGVYWYYDPSTRRFIIEWDSLSYYAASSVRDKFQVIIYDSTYVTSTGDNMIIVQYMTANRYTSSTVGIKDPTETIGIQYLFDGSYHPAAAMIQPNRAIKYTTQSPQGIFDYNAQYSITNYLSLIRVFPNPFHSQTNIHLNTAIREPKPIKIYNSSGRLIKSFTPHSSLLTAPYSFIWDGKDEIGIQVGTGIYFITIEGLTKPQKIIRLK